MITILRFFLLFIILLFSLSESEGSSSTPFPIIYPIDTIKSKQPYIIWQDLYNKRDGKKRIRYRITMKSNTDKHDPVIFYPDVYYKNYMVFQYPIELKNGDYFFTIDRLLNNKPLDSGYYHYLKYPIKEEFKLDSTQNNEIDDLLPEHLIRYLYLERKNRFINGYNSLFYGSSGIASLGVGILFLTVFDFGIISTVISVLSLSSSLVGLTASGYYGYKYFDKKNDLHEIIKIGKDISVNSKFSKDKINTEIELSF